MLDALGAALALPALPWLGAAAFIAGAVYGFAGFGAALFFMPLAARLTDPLTAVAAFSLTALGSAFTVLPGAWAVCDRRASLWILAAAFLFLPLGILVLRFGDPVALRWAVSAIVLGTLGLMITGWRYRFTPGPGSWSFVGALMGFFGGSTGINGPPVILFNLAGKAKTAVIRANTIVPLTVSSFATLPLLILQGAAPARAVAAGALLLPVYAFGSWVGRRYFDPERASLYRSTAYVIIAASALSSLPLWG
ncbi:MAG: sulfite exporter TauE/SafE family protein [Pseudomonadota bacterium]